MVNASDMSSTEALPIMNDERDHVATVKWSSSKKGLLTLVSVTVMLNSAVYMYEAANTRVHAITGLALLLTNLFAATVIDYVGCYVILLIGSLAMSVSTMIIAFADSYKALLVAGILQGISSALADTTGLVIVASVFKQRPERIQAFAITWSIKYFGKLALGPLTVLWRVFFRNDMLLATYALIYLIIFIALVVSDKSVIKQITDTPRFSKPAVPIWKLVTDGQILVKIGFLILSTELFALAYFGHSRPLWMNDYLRRLEWTRIVAWLPAYVPYVLGAMLVVALSKKHAHYLGRTMTLCLAVECVCCYVNRFIRNYMLRMIPICSITFCIAIIDVAILASFAQHMENRYKVASYGAIYALANVAYSLAFSTSHLIGSSLLEMTVTVSAKLGKVIESLLNFPFLRRY